MVHVEVSISAELKRRKIEEEEEGRGDGPNDNVQGDHSKTPKSSSSKRRPGSAKKVLTLLTFL